MDKFINRVDIITASLETQKENRAAAVESMRNEVNDFINACMEEAKQYGITSKLHAGVQIKIHPFFQHYADYYFPEELKKEIEDAGYYFSHYNRESFFKVWG